MTLQKYIKLYIKQIKSGARQTERGRNYAPSTIRAIVTAMNQWAAFQKHVHRVYDFDDIDMKCYYDYTTFLKKSKCDDKDSWNWFVRFMDMYCVEGSFCGKTYKYLYWGEYRYWMMDSTPEECDLINRCIIPDDERKPENFPNIIR